MMDGLMIAIFLCLIIVLKVIILSMGALKITESLLLLQLPPRTLIGLIRCC